MFQFKLRLVLNSVRQVVKLLILLFFNSLNFWNTIYHGMGATHLKVKRCHVVSGVDSLISRHGRVISNITCTTEGLIGLLSEPLTN